MENPTLDSVSLPSTTAQDNVRSEAARLMGRVSTPVKREAARKNGRLGGRPKGFRLSEESRRKISESKLRRITEAGAVDAATYTDEDAN